MPASPAFRVGTRGEAIDLGSQLASRSRKVSTAWTKSGSGEQRKSDRKAWDLGDRDADRQEFAARVHNLRARCWKRLILRGFYGAAGKD